MTISIQSLKQFSLLSAVADEDLEALKQDIRIREVSKDEILFVEGEAITALFFVIKGWFKAEKVSQDGRQQTLRFIGPGESINELSVFSNEKNAVNVIAMEPAMVFSISQNKIEKMVVESPNFSRAVITGLALRVQYLLNQITNLSLYSVEERVARYLLDETEGGVVKRQSWKTQSEIAAHLGTVLDVFNRTLQKFAKQGFIAIDRDQIRIKNQTALEQIAKSTE